MYWQFGQLLLNSLLPSGSLGRGAHTFFFPLYPKSQLYSIKLKERPWISDQTHPYLWYLGHFSKSSSQWNKCQVLTYFKCFRCDSLMRSLCLQHTVFLHTRWNLRGFWSKHVGCSWHEIIVSILLLVSSLAISHSRRKCWGFCVLIQDRKMGELFLSFVRMAGRFRERKCPVNQNGTSQKEEFALTCVLGFCRELEPKGYRCVCGERDWI